MFRFKIDSEKQVLQRILENDRTVLGEIFMRYERMISSHIQSNGGNHDDAEDILQESIIVVWQQVTSGRFEPNARISTFLMAVAKNKWLAELRRRRHLTSEEGIVDQVTDDPDPLEEVMVGEQSTQFLRAFEQIQAVCRQLLTLYYFEERSMNDIAGIMHFANSDVAKSKKYQCIKALEKLLRRREENVGRSSE